jgi:Cu(I)/Ag(I) efflux system membrane fusion protein
MALGLVAAALLAAGYWVGRTQGGGDASTAHTATAAALSGDAAKPARKLLYYRNPMGLPDTSPTPKKDPMGMDYIPVYEGEDAAADDAAPGGTVRVSTEKVQKLGVRVEAAALRPLGASVRAAGRVEVDERRVSMVAPRFDGYIERLHVNATGQTVAKGQPLFDVYSPDLVATQREYVLATQAGQALQTGTPQSIAGIGQVAEAALARLRNAGLSDDEIERLVRSGEVRRTVTQRAPVSGVVTEKKALAGMRFMAGEGLFQISDLGTVWVIADLPEQDVAQVRPGAKASVTLTAYPGQTFSGTVTYVYPTLKAETRTVPVRLELANPGLRLKPGMYAQVELQGGPSKPVLTVPDSALLDTGTRRLVLVQRGEGRFEPRDVRIGQRSADWVEIVDGLKEGEAVVVAANFLIDAESNLKAAVGNFGHAAHGASPGASKGAIGEPAAGKAASHRASGTVAGVDVKEGTISLSHGPVESLKWPAMTMEFKVANEALLQKLKAGAKVTVEFVERSQGEWVITNVVPQIADKEQAKAAPVVNPHAGH